MRARTWIFFVAMAAMVYARLQYHASFFPAFFEGEEGKSLDLAKSLCDYAAYSHSVWATFIGELAEYNKGYSFFLIPFYLRFGYDVRIITYILPFFFSVFCAVFFTLYRKAYPRSSLLSFVLAALFSVLCLSLRRYKWHSMMYLTAISVYVYFLPQFQHGISQVRARWLKALSLFLFAVSCYFYFGCFIYAIPFLLLIHFFNTKEQRSRDLKALAIGIVAFALPFSAACHYDAVWRERIAEEFGYMRADLSLRGLEQRWHATRDFFFTLDLSFPYLVLFSVGALATWHRIRRGDRFALVNGTLLACLWAFELAIQGLNNPDQLNWSMIPLLGVLLMGADEILVPIRDRVRCGWAIGLALVVLVGAHEMGHYRFINRETPYQPYVQPRNTMAQAALVLMIIRDDTSGAVQYYLPQPGVAEADGGFNYSVSLDRVDFIRALSKVTFFSDAADLRAKLAAQPTNKRSVAFLSSGELPGGIMPVDPAAQPLLGRPPVIVHPFADIYGIEYMIRKFQFRPGPHGIDARL